MEHGIVLIGGGGHALVVAGSLRRQGTPIAGYLDDAREAVLGEAPSPVERLGSISELPGIARSGHGIILCVGDVDLRSRMIGTHVELRHAVVVVDLGAIVASTAGLEEGGFVSARAVVQERAQVGRHGIINTGAIVEHECRLGSNVHVAPGAVLGGRVSVGDNTLVGLGSRVLPGVKVGRGCVIGAGAVVTRDVPDGGRVAGVPARAI